MGYRIDLPVAITLHNFQFSISNAQFLAAPGCGSLPLLYERLSRRDLSRRMPPLITQQLIPLTRTALNSLEPLDPLDPLEPLGPLNP